MRKTIRGAALEEHRLGPHPLIRHYLERMNVRGILRGCLGSGLQQSLDHAEVLSVLVHNILVSRGPMYRIREWAQRIEPEALGLTAAQVDHLNDDRIVRSLEALASERGRNVFFRLALRVIKDFQIRTPRVHFDTTTVTFFGQYATSRAEPRITHGVSKDHRPDLKQLLFGLNVSCDGAVPLLHHVLSGNRTDDSVHVRNTDLLRTLLGTEDFIYVADSKLCTRENLQHIAAYGGRFVTVMPRTRREDRRFRQQLREGQPPVRWRQFHAIPNHRRQEDPPDLFYGTRAGPQDSEEGYRIVWVRSSQKADLDRQLRDAHLRTAEIELHALAGKVGTRRLRTRTAIKKKVATILSTHAVADFLQVRLASFTEVEHRYLRRGRPRSGDPMRRIAQRRLKLEITRDKEAIRREARTDGVFPLITNLRDRSRREVLEIYKYQPYLEKRFSHIKTELEIAPVYLKKPRRVAGLIHAYFIALALVSLVERQVRLAMQQRKIAALPLLPEGRATQTPTAARILEAFTDVCWYEFERDGETVAFPITLSALQTQLLELLDVPRTAYQ